jgi:hypothetical protein
MGHRWTLIRRNSETPHFSAFFFNMDVQDAQDQNSRLGGFDRVHPVNPCSVFLGMDVWDVADVAGVLGWGGSPGGKICGPSVCPALYGEIFVCARVRRLHRHFETPKCILVFTLRSRLHDKLEPRPEVGKVYYGRERSPGS